jgi:hypothetical protein
MMLWFKPWGLVYRPVSLAGWMFSLIAVAFCVHIFLFVDGRSHSVSDTFYGIFPYWVPTILAWLWLASRTSGNRERASD